MNSIIKAFQAELIKSRRTYGFLLSIIIPVLVAVLQFLIFYFKHEYFAKIGRNPWNIMGGNLYNFNGIIILPIYLVIIAYLINFTEHRSGSWKYLFSLPVPKFTIYTAKILLVFLWMLIFCTLSTLLLYAGGYLLSVMRPDIGFQDYNSNLLIGITSIKLFISGAGILSFQFFISIYWKDFIRPVGIGVACVIIALILNSWESIYIFPYSHPKQVAESFMNKETQILIKPLFLSISYAVVFFLGGYFLLSKQEVK